MRNAELTSASERLLSMLQPPATDTASRIALMKKLQALVQRELKEFFGPRLSAMVGSGTLHLFGSSAAGLHLPGADLDLTLCLDRDVSISVKGSLVNAFAAAFRKSGLHDVKAIPTARVPIVTVSDPEFGLSSDISINNRLPLANTKLVRTYTLIDDRVRQLCCLVKAVGEAALSGRGICAHAVVVRVDAARHLLRAAGAARAEPAGARLRGPTLGGLGGRDTAHRRRQARRLSLLR